MSSNHHHQHLSCDCTNPARVCAWLWLCVLALLVCVPLVGYAAGSVSLNHLLTAVLCLASVAVLVASLVAVITGILRNASTVIVDEQPLVDGHQPEHALGPTAAYNMAGP